MDVIFKVFDTHCTKNGTLKLKHSCRDLQETSTYINQHQE